MPAIIQTAQPQVLKTEKETAMRKFIGGQYVPVSDQDAPPKKKAGPAAQSGAAGKPAGVKVDVSRAAIALMAEQPAGFDWSGLVGTGAGGQVNVSDVRNFIAAKKAG
ncbi:MAG TPA: hypothetical protein DIW20_07965 [Rhodospirillaceae bacterium]|nr:hypothetical protein [Rhodospirillaceae bacterium]